jgi:hypothetical protein
MADWIRHALGLPCAHPVAGHEFVPARHPGWHGMRRCIWLAHPQANRCFRSRRCHAALRTLGRYRLPVPARGAFTAARSTVYGYLKER